MPGTASEFFQSILQQLPVAAAWPVTLALVAGWIGLPAKLDTKELATVRKAAPRPSARKARGATAFEFR